MLQNARRAVQAVNDGVGLVLHSCLLVPYFSWCAHPSKAQ